MNTISAKIIHMSKDKNRTEIIRYFGNDIAGRGAINIGGIERPHFSKTVPIKKMISAL